VHRLVITIAVGFALCACESNEEQASTSDGADPPPPKLEDPKDPKQPDPAKPPSTGKEMPKGKERRLTPEQAKQAIARVGEEMQKPEPACGKVLEVLTLAIPVVAPTPNADNATIYQAYQTCALKLHRWQSLLRATAALVEGVGATGTRPELIVFALANLGELDKAKQAFAELGKKFPEARDGLLWARSVTICKQADWKGCEKATDEGLAHAKKKGELTAAVREQMFLNTASLVYLGDLEKAGKRAEFLTTVGLGKAAEGIQRMIAKTASWKMMIDGDRISKQIPLGIYHLIGTVGAQPIAELHFYNHAGVVRNLRVEAEISGVTQRSSRSVTLLKSNKREVLRLAPPLKADFDITKIRSEMPAQLAVKVTELDPQNGDRVLLDETAQVVLLPRDALPLRSFLGTDHQTQTFENIAAWVTPNDKAIDPFLAEAKKLHPKKMFVGEQADTVSQVKAIYDALKARGVTYVMDPTVATDLIFVQRTRLPAEVLASTNAQCLEGTILFATLLEAVGIKPLIAMVPGHAFVGWKTTAADGTGGKPLFVETTMVGNAEFRDAVKVATARAQSEDKAGNFARGVSHLLDLDRLRKGGYKSQPL
jgi:hypothetical protein